MAIEAKRGCGYRKVGGIYLVAPALGEGCHRLPFELHICPTCNQGIKQSRGWQWINAQKLFGKCDGGAIVPGSMAGHAAAHCMRCPACNPEITGERAGLIWIGEGFYKTAEDFRKEAAALGISRRVKAVPRGFELGKDWVYLAHPKAIHSEAPAPEDGELLKSEWKAGVFSAFRPERIEMLITEKQATKKKLKELDEKGITPVIVPNDDKDHQGTVYDKDEEEGT